jgi:16S rRNA (adenine1518-N6/adenine1519-N6)-dimethyltransferase
VKILGVAFANTDNNMKTMGEELKKSLGQHFLTDEAVQLKIAEAIGDLSLYETVIEIGPGKGALTQHLLKKYHSNLWLIELDNRWAAWLKSNFAAKHFDHGKRILNEDFMKLDMSKFKAPIHVVGNFPYNVSSQIVFKIIDEKETVQALTGMFQKEVAKRIAALPGKKDYGVVSVLAQASYDCEYLFDVPAECFSPPPKVVSGVIRMQRHNRPLGCDEKLFKNVVKQAFTQRRKTLRNSIKSFLQGKNVDAKILDKRPEQLSIQEFSELVNLLA